jgi:hypothetical protein
MRNRHRDIDAAARLGNALDLRGSPARRRNTSARFRARTCRWNIRCAKAADVAFGSAAHRARGRAAWKPASKCLGLANAAAVADAGQHIAEGSVHCHRCVSPYQLDFTRPGPWPSEASSRKRDTRHLELAVVTARTARHFAAVAHAHLGASCAAVRPASGVALKRSSIGLERSMAIAFSCGALGAYFDQLAAALVLFDCADFCHDHFLFTHCRY